MAGDALALAEFLEGMGGGGAVGKEGYESSRDTDNSSDSTVHVSHKSGVDVYLKDKGWFSDAKLDEWMGVDVDSDSGRVIGVDLKGKGLVGPMPKCLASVAVGTESSGWFDHYDLPNKRSDREDRPSRMNRTMMLNCDGKRRYERAIAA